ncbi:hypothetical protein GCM10009837_17310 [Streptomyces durmitorensis]|uniref:Uncharacterized protein n=1 Tax=Streptomyces durmitorensis TaxID=319947 RepID=A0ABY4PRJ0_9ACTN|nr:hypothetical protein [Streptomyces durmitorensis]UQT55573.1 hypothetical protein M4V62_10980 [Streptomyces durmitorensis]
MTDAPLPAELLLDRDVSDDLRRELVSALEGLGVHTARVRRAVDHRGAADIPWIMLASLPLQAFLSGLGAEAVKDSYTAFKDVVRRSSRAADPAHGTDPAGPAPRPLVLQDRRTGLRVVLEPGLPGEAYEQLLGLDLARFSEGPLHYDSAQGRWRSELDEAAG